MARHQAFCLLLVVAVVYGQTIRKQTCTKDDNSAEIQPGSTALLGGILSLSEPGTDGFGCGKPSGSMQALEAIRWVLDLLNKKNEFLQTEFLDNTYVPDVTLGMKVVNPCKSKHSALASIGDIYQGVNGDDSKCTAQNNQVVFGVVGGSTSDEAMTLSLAMQPMEIPLVSFEATAPQLTRSGMYTNFMRTVAPDSLMTEVIQRIMTELKWNYISIVYDSGTFGKAAFSELHTRMVAEGLCLRLGVPVDSSDLSDGNMDYVLNTILSTDVTGVVFFGSFSLAKALLERANDRIAETGHLQWIFTDFPIDSSLNIEYMRGIISVTSAYRFIVEFEDHWIRIDESNPSAENPWFQAWFEEKHGCLFNPSVGQRNCNNLYPGLNDLEKEKQKRQEFLQDQYVEPAVMAVFTYAKALRMAQMQKCPAGGACSALINMDRKEFYENYLKKVDFTFTSDERVPSLASRNVLPYNAAKHLSFDDRGDIDNPSFYIWNYHDVSAGVSTGKFNFKRVGTYINDFLNMNPTDLVMYDKTRQQRLSPLPNSLCPSIPCPSCIGLPTDIKYFYEPGDVIISGIFSLHDKGSAPMSCGNLKKHNEVMYMEAMIYAIQSINNDPSILPNTKLGGLGLDDCSSKIMGPSLISQIERRNLMIKDSSGNVMNPLSVEAYTAAYTSPLTDPLAMMMNHMKRPLVGYRAGSSMLDNQEMYPYFIRSAPFIHDEVKAIILLLKNHGWMYVQLLTSDVAYSVDAAKHFRGMAAKEGICIVSTLNVGDSIMTAKTAVQGLGMNSETPIVVALLESSGYHNLVVALHEQLAIRSQITLIAGAYWGTDTGLFKGMEATVEGVITVSLKHSSLQSFQNYLRTLNAASYKANPWFMEWFSQAHDCSMGSRSGGKPPCDYSKAINDGTMFDVIYEVDSVINGVKALALALNQLLSSTSSTNTAEKGLKLMEYLRKSTFTIEDMDAPNLFRFIGSSAAIPFQVNNFVNSAFKQVGEITTWSNTITMPTSVVLYKGVSPANVHTKCPQPCLECMYLFNHQDYISVDGDIIIAAVMNIHHAGKGLFNCGDLRIKNGALYPEVFNFALNRINNGLATIKLNNVKLGSWIFDGCSNPTRSLAIMNRVTTGFMPPSDGEMTFSDIMAWVTYDSETTKEAAMFLQQLNMPVVSPAATQPELANKTSFETLFRTVNSDAVVAKGMADFVNSMGWKFVLLLNSPDASNREAAGLFREYLKGFGICVLAQYEFVTDGSMEVIVNSLVSADSQVVAVFAEPEQHIKDLLETKSKPSFFKVLKFIANRPWTPYEKDYSGILANSVFFHLHNPTIAEFLTYLNTKQVATSHNPWLHDIYEEYFNCDYPGSFSSRPDCASTTRQLGTSSLYSQDIWTLTTINAVYALAEGLHRTLKEKCGDGYSGVCSKFRRDDDTRERLMVHMDEETFTDISGVLFDFVEREAHRGYNLIRYTSGGTTQKEGQLSSSGDLTLINMAVMKNYYVGIKSECQGDCLVCQDSGAIIQDFSFVDGDMFIIGLFDVHKKGSHPFACGEINDKHGVQLLEAFHFALDYVNNRKGIFRDFQVQIGGIGLDMCQSPSLAANLVANIHSGKVTLSKQGTTINPRNIDAYIGTMDTESSVRVADILNKLMLRGNGLDMCQSPTLAANLVANIHSGKLTLTKQGTTINPRNIDIRLRISYGATGMELLDREKYNYFVRSVPADDKMGRAMISYLKKFGYNNVQVIKSFDEIGEPGAAEFERLAEVNLVCITKKYLVGEYGDLKGDVEKLITQISFQANAKVVILWMKNPMPVLEVLSRNIAFLDKTLFVATDKWGADPDYLQRFSLFNLLRKKNLILLDVETADVPGFDMYLAERTPDNYKTNPWFKEFYDLYHKCGQDASTCNRTIPRQDNYVQDPYVLYVVNAVFSAAMGIKEALTELCARSPQAGMCNFFTTSGERRQKILKHLKKVKFQDDTHQPFFFTDDGQSDRGFHFYNITDSNALYRYENVGSYNDSNFLKLDITYDNDYQAKCDVNGQTTNSDKCTCDFKIDLPSRYMKKDEGGRGLTLVYVGDLHKEHPTNPYRCGKINTGVDLHRMLAFFYAIDRINANKDFDLQDSVRFDGIALDSCTNSLRLGQDVYNILSGNQLCDSDEEGQITPPSSIAAFVVDKDKNAIPVSSMLSPQGITSISPTATHSILDDPFQHAKFLRTQSSDAEINRVILEVADALDWNMMGVIHTNTLAHNSAKESLLRESTTRENRICVGSMASLNLNASIIDATEALDRVSQQSGVTGVILFVEPAHFRLLMESSQILGSTGIVWVIPSNWDTAEADIQKYRSEVSSSIWIQTKSQILWDFNKYVKQISLTNHMGIPDDWFQEIYETIHHCKIINLQNRADLAFTNICDGSEKMTDAMLIQDPSILHVIISVYAAALGLNSIPACRGTNLGVAACLQLQKKKNELIYDNILNVNFEVLPELLGNKTFEFSFNEDGNGDAGYLITSRDENGKAIRLGEYSTTGLDIELKSFQQTTSFTQGGVPTSRCAPGAICTCHISNDATDVFSPDGAIRKLEDVQVNKRYRDPQTGEIVLVEKIPKVGDRFDEIWAIVIMAVAALGGVVALALFLYLLVMYPVRGGTSVIGYIMTFGIVLLYLMVFPFIAHADERICGLRRFGLGIVYAIVYSALLVKLIDCWRVRGKNDAYSAKYSKLGRPAGLFFVTVFLVLIQGMINAEWLILKEPEVERVFYNNIYWPRCVPDDFYDESLVLSLSYVMCLILLSFFLGVGTFSLTVNHREARWIFAVIGLSIPCWVIWCAVSILGAYKVRDAAVAIGLVVNATFMLLLMPIRKLYLLHKYNVMIEEEDKAMMSDENSEYASVYGRQYDNRPQLHSGSVRGSNLGYSKNSSGRY